MTTASPVNAKVPSQKAAWGWIALNIFVMALALLADVLTRRADRQVQATFRGLVHAEQVWLLGLFMALVWVGLFVVYLRLAPFAPRWAFALMVLLTGLLLVLSFPALWETFGRIRLFMLYARFWLHNGFSRFSSLTLKLLFLLDLWGWWESRRVKVLRGE